MSGFRVLWTKDKETIHDELTAQLDERHRHYRAGGIGLSATIIAICGGIIVQVDSLEINAWIKLAFLIVCGVSIISALLIQFCNYMGHKIEARATYSDLELHRVVVSTEAKYKGKEEVSRDEDFQNRLAKIKDLGQKLKTKEERATSWFTTSDVIVWVAAIGCVLGLLGYGLLLGNSFLYPT